MAQQVIYRSKEKNIFAAAPLSEAQKMLLSMAAAEGMGYMKGEREKELKFGCVDVRRAYFYAPA